MERKESKFINNQVKIEAMYKSLQIYLFAFSNSKKIGYEWLLSDLDCKFSQYSIKNLLLSSNSISFMKRTSESCKFPSFRQKVQRKVSNNQHFTAQDFAPDIELQTQPSNQSDVTKKIQAKLRLRRATGSQKKISRETGQPSNASEKPLDESDPFQECQEKINYLWENSHDVSEVLEFFADTIDGKQLKKQLLKEKGMLQCHFVTQGYQEVVVNRLKRLGEMAKAQKRCAQQQSLLGKKFEERMKKLNQMLKPR